jgi:hypothetical protein
VLKAKAILLFVLTAGNSFAQEPLYPYVFFTNSQMEGDYIFSTAKATLPSKIYQLKGRLPVVASNAHTPGNALRLSYTSQPSGKWVANIFKPEIRGKDFFIKPKFLSLWIFNDSPELSGHNFPVCHLIKRDSSLSAPVKIGRTKYNKWAQVIIPLEKFEMVPDNIIGIRFSQNPGSAGKQSLYIDDIELINDVTKAKLPAPIIKKVKGYSKHIDIEWEPVTDTNIRFVKIYRYVDRIRPSGAAVQEVWNNRYSDFTGATGVEYSYRISYLDKMYNES